MLSPDDVTNEPGAEEFVHRVVPAAEAEPLGAAGPNSVFALGGGAAPPADEPARASRRRTGPKPDKSRPEPGSVLARALDHIDQVGPLTVAAAGQLLGLDAKRARSCLMNLRARYGVVRVKGADGISRWDRQEARASAPAPVPKPARVQAAGGPAALEPSIPAQPPAAPESDLVCGLLSTGELMIETEDGSLRLSRHDTRRLVGYLDLVAGALTAMAA